MGRQKMAACLAGREGGERGGKEGKGKREGGRKEDGGRAAAGHGSPRPPPGCTPGGLLGWEGGRRGSPPPTPRGWLCVCFFLPCCVFLCSPLLLFSLPHSSAAMATQVLGQAGGSSLFPGGANLGMALPGDMYDLHELSKAELAAPQLIMLANVALTGEVNGNCCDYLVGEERQMAELTTVGDSNFSDSDGEGMEDAQPEQSDREAPENVELSPLEVPSVENEGPVACPAPEAPSADKEAPLEAPGTPESTEDKCKSLKSKPFRCKPCQYEAESEEEFVHHIRVHSAKKFFVEENAEKQAQVKESDSCTTEEVDFSKGPIRCDRCGYNTNRYDHYLAHLKHHNKAGENERVYKCTICTYTTVSEYHWKKHLRNHFPRKVYTCSQCSYFSDRKNNYIQHIRTHTGKPLIFFFFFLM